MTKTKIIAEAGKQEMVITRRFDVPRELVLAVCHAQSRWYQLQE